LDYQPNMEKLFGHRHLLAMSVRRCH